MRFLLVAALLVVGPTATLADDLQPEIAEASGNWVGLSFSDGATTKICVAGTIDAKLAFRSDANDLELRTGNKSWSLSSDTTGDVTVKVGNVEKTIHMATFDATTLAGQIAEDDASALMDAMDNAASATITFGSKKSTTVSLSGSTRALNSFRTCSAVHGFAKLGNSAGKADNPF